MAIYLHSPLPALAGHTVLSSRDRYLEFPTEQRASRACGRQWPSKSCREISERPRRPLPRQAPCGVAGGVQRAADPPALLAGQPQTPAFRWVALAAVNRVEAALLPASTPLR